MTDAFHISNVPERMKSRFTGKPERLSICFWMWALFNSVSDEEYPAYADRVVREIKDRGFNCVRMDDGAGLFCDIHGVPRGPIRWHLQAGPYQATRQKPGEGSGLIPKRLLIFCKAAEKYEVKLILSSWYYMHTNWHLEESINAELFEALPSAADRIRYFTDEHDRILRLLKENDLLHVVAFVELFNEFDNMKFTLTGNTSGITPEEAAQWRPLQETAYDRLKRNYPELLFAYDSHTPRMMKELIPRNVDILNFHYYYMWSSLYGWLDKSLSGQFQKDMDFPPETAYFMRKDRLHYEDVVRERTRYTKIRNGFEWTPRIMVYNSLDPAKIPELEQRLTEKFEERCGDFMSYLKEGLACVIKIRDEVLPGAPIVMGEGTSCCTCEKVLFEEHSDKFWSLLEEQALILRESGLWGTVIRTAANPEDVSWNMREKSFRKVNELFLNGEAGE